MWSLGKYLCLKTFQMCDNLRYPAPSMRSGRTIWRQHSLTTGAGAVEIMCSCSSLPHTYYLYWTGSKSSARVGLVRIKTSESFPTEINIKRIRVILIKYSSHRFKSPSFYTDCLSVSGRNGPHYGKKQHWVLHFQSMV